RGLGLGQALLLGQRVGQVHVNVRVVRVPRKRLAQERLGRRKVPARERVLASREAAFGAVERKVPPHASPSRFYCRVAATKERPMSGFAEYERYDGLGLAALVARREVTPEELLEAAIARVEARNPVVNAVTMKLYDYGRQAIAAGLPDGPFRGVPYLMKDLTASIAGVPMTRSSRYYADAPPPAADSEHARRLEHAVTLSVRDCAALLDATAGTGPGDPYVAPPLARPLSLELGADAGRLRIAFTSVTPNGAKVEAESLRTLAETAKLCAELGHQVEEANPVIDGGAVVPTFLTLAAANTVVNLAGNPA